MLVLGIESSCDETACAVVRNGKEILSNIVSSQIGLHEVYGGVVPELACRRHIEVIVPIIDQALQEANVTLEQIDLIAVAYSPGLIGALLIGLNSAKALALALNKPFIGVNHIEAHLYAATMLQDRAPSFPCLGAVYSGAHTSLVLMRSISDYTEVSQTVDDAIGEAFDKVARIMGLPYPGGPPIEVLAKEGDPYFYTLRAGQVKGKPLHFSYSGLKTAVLYSLKGQNRDISTPLQLSDVEMRNIAASFQQAAFRDLINKTLLAAREHGCRDILFGGGVTNNQTLRQMFSAAATDIGLYWPSAGLSLDNAAMIAGMGYHLYQQRGCGDAFDLEAAARLVT